MSLGEITYTFVMIKNPKYCPQEPYIYFISDLKDAKAIANHYQKRWKIECCFKHLKTNGFNIEDINFESDQKIELMMGVLTMVYLIALREGLLKHKLKPIPIKKYKDGTEYLKISIFRYGFALIQTLFGQLNKLKEYIQIQLNPLTVNPPDKKMNLELIKNVQ